jgi:hypothetical protein
MTKIHVQEIGDDIETNETLELVKESLPAFYPDDMPFPTEEDFYEIKWPKKEDYQQLLNKYKYKELGAVKLLKKGEDDILIRPSYQEVFTVESHPPPSRQHTKVVQETTKFKTKDYNEGDTVWMWDTKKGEPTNFKGSVQFCLRPFRVGRK